MHLFNFFVIYGSLNNFFVDNYCTYSLLNFYTSKLLIFSYRVHSESYKITIKIMVRDKFDVLIYSGYRGSYSFYFMQKRGLAQEALFLIELILTLSLLKVTAVFGYSMLCEYEGCNP